MARELEIPIELVRFPNSGELTEAVAMGAVDVAFMPMDAERAKRVDFSTPYALFESTFLVPAGSAIKSLAEVDRPDVRPGGIANTTTARSAIRFLKKTTLVEARSVDELTAMMKDGKVDAVALSRESLTSLSATLPGARILDGNFHASGVGPRWRKTGPLLTNSSTDLSRRRRPRALSAVSSTISGSRRQRSRRPGRCARRPRPQQTSLTH